MGDRVSLSVVVLTAWPPSTLTPEGAIAHQGCLCSVSGSRNPSVPAASRLAVLVRHASDNLAPSQDGEKARLCGARSEGADDRATMQR